MRIAVLSDIHDNVWNLKAALHWMETLTDNRSVQEMIICGDLCSPFIVDRLAEKFTGRIIIVKGNNDGDQRQITLNAKKYNHVDTYGEFFQGEFGGKRIAVNHYPDIALAIAASGEYDVVFYGHNHSYQPNPSVNVRAINPGTLMGYNPLKEGEDKDVAATFIIYDTDTEQAQGYEVAASWQSPHEPGKVIPFTSREA